MNADECFKKILLVMSCKSLQLHRDLLEQQFLQE